MSFRLGFQTHLHGTQPARELYPAIVDLFVAAEELGFDSGWVAQHHLSTAEGRLPSPLVFYGAVAEATRRIRLGTAILTLSLDDPLRAAEDAAVLDAISGGRLELGLGSANPHPDQFRAFGRDPERRRELYAASRTRFEAALTGEDLAPGLALRPDGGALLDRVWETPLHPERARETAAAGHGILVGIGPAGTVQFDLAREYLAAFVGAQPRLAVVHAAIHGSDRTRVAAGLWPDLRDNSLDYYVNAGWVRPDPEPEELLRAMNVHHGTSEDIAASLAAEPVLGLATELILAVQAHTTPVSEAIQTLEVIATEIAPSLGWSPATASPSTIGVLP